LINVSPIPLVLSGGAMSTTAEITNDSPEEFRCQVQGYNWSQTPAGEDKIDPTSELLIFPQMVIVPPNSKRKLRVATQGGYAQSERAFRAIFAELPADYTPSSSTGVKLIYQIGVPVFVVPPGAKPELRIEGLSATKDHVRFNVRNVGSAHVNVNKVRLDFVSDGKTLASKDVPGWYVLAGAVRPFDVNVGATCVGAKTLVVSVAGTFSNISLSGSLERPGCG
jgi:fimbrial chaperone protein